MGAKRQSVPSPRTYAVLCVDDHAPGLNIRKIFLESFGYQVETASSGAIALELAAAREFDAVVLDYRMPGMSGLELARALRRRFPSLPLIVLSGYVSDIPQELPGLVSAFVTKGSHPEVLLRKLAELVGGPAPVKRPRAALDTSELLARSEEHVKESKRQVRRAHEAAARIRGRSPGRRSA